MNFAIGQRVVSQSEPKLGLGIVESIDNRRLQILFPAVDDTRIYAMASAPLSRVVFKTGDVVRDMDNQSFEIVSCENEQELATYIVTDEHGETLSLSEIQISPFINLSHPLDRFDNGQFDRNSHFRNRVETLFYKDHAQKSPVRGLLGGRSSLLPHQIYIAHQVAKSPAPRVLLADEVGLGKTIEAGMILHQHLQTGQIKRVLIAVPTTLVHQWLVEMLRKFNIRFSIFDEQRFDSLIEEDETLNPFDTAQCVIASVDFLTQNEAAQHAASATQWDMLIVDEAHHLAWSETDSSPEYQCIERLSACSRGLILLTATPEQSGLSGHFARLRLLDPARFYDLNAFIEETDGYEQVAQLATELNENIKAQQANSETLQATLADYEIDTQLEQKQQLSELLDRFGTGRVLYRNTRDSVTGFMDRLVFPYSLSEDENKNEWLAELMLSEGFKKVLIICHRAEEAIALEQHLKLKHGFRTAVFHEGMSIIERDRAAAYFADIEEGAEALVCSEIGSEGRNFQFANHLVMMDLPDNPDLLEQRIGRLDRIGQFKDIHIHVPFVENSAEAMLYEWYQEGLNAFEDACVTGYALYQRFKEELAQWTTQESNDSSGFQSFLEAVKAARIEQEAAHQHGRNVLLELNSCNEDVASDLIEEIEVYSDRHGMRQCLASLTNMLGLEHEEQSDGTVIVRPSEHAVSSEIGDLPEEGITFTFDRPFAVSNENIAFCTWEHPFILNGLDFILGAELGNAAVATMSLKALPEGTLFLECFFTCSVSAPSELQLDRFFPLRPLRVLVERSGKNLSENLPHDKLNDISEGVKRGIGVQVLKELGAVVHDLMAHAKTHAQASLDTIQIQGKEAFELELEQEIARLTKLQRINQTVRQSEIDVFQDRLSQGREYIDSMSLNLDCARIVINT